MRCHYRGLTWLWRAHRAGGAPDRVIRVHVRCLKQSCQFASSKFVLHSIPHTGISCRNFFHSTIIQPWRSGGCLGCPEKGTRSKNYNLFVRSAVFQPKWNDVQKTYKNHQNPVKSYYFLGYFQSLFNFGWKTATQTN